MGTDLLRVGVEVVVLIIGFAFGWGKLTQRLDEHIKTMGKWQEEIADWQRRHAQDAKERASLVVDIGNLLERQQVMNEYINENLKRINGKLWP